ncbi:hypothetical protein BSKO_02044 [Bryopsis sp. KO-2023]|nr:hypothetical protein BSKO_02044 [Bryopsis sp. KO-2023]
MIACQRSTPLLHKNQLARRSFRRINTRAHAGVSPNFPCPVGGHTRAHRQSTHSLLPSLEKHTPGRSSSRLSCKSYLPPFESFLGLSRAAWVPIVGGAFRITGTIIAVYVFLGLLGEIRKHLSQELHGSQTDTTVEFCKLLFKSLYPPMTVFFPFIALVHSCRVGLASLDELALLCSDCTGLLKYEHVIRRSKEMLLQVDKVVWDFAIVCFLALGVWFLVSLKNRYVMWFLDDKSYQNPAYYDFKRIVVPMNTLSSWVMVGVGIMLGFHVAGIDVKPLLAFGSVSGVIVGLAAQSVVSNMISGINLFLSRPFVAGDRIEVFASNGNRVLGGVVEHVNPLRTVIRVDKGYPLEVPNKVLADLIIGNESRTIGNPEPEGGRRVVVKAKLGYAHLDKVEDITSKITELVGKMNGINNLLSHGASISSITDSQIIVDIQATSMKKIASFTALRLSLVVAVRQLLEEMEIEDAKLGF